MKPPEAEMRTDAFPYDYYPDHWGPFPIHEIFPIEKPLRALEVEHYYICLTTPRNPHPIFVGFDDFASVWPVDPDLPEEAIARREKLRGSAEFRALVRVRKLKHLTASGIERLRDAGADVSEAACREGCLVVAITGKYWNFPEYFPDRKRGNVLFVPYIHEFGTNDTLSQRRTDERKLRIVSADMRTLARSMLYFERIKLRCFMRATHNENKETVPVDDRDIEWFVQKYMEKHPLAETAPRKPQVYRGARKHTSEVRHCFVCHAEWLLHESTLGTGSERVISRRVLEQWAADAPAKREGAARDGRDGWGKWDVQWDQDDRPAFYKKEAIRLKYFIAQLRREKEKNDSGDEGGDEDEGEDVEMASTHSSGKRPTSTVMRGGKVKGGNYGHAWISSKRLGKGDEGMDIPVDSDQDGDDAASLDDQSTGPGPKRRKSNSGTSQQSSWSNQRAGTTSLSLSSGTRVAYQRSSPSLGTGFRSSQSLGAPPSQPQAGPSRLSWRDSSVGQAEPMRSEKQVDFIILSSDHDSSVRNNSPPILEIPSDSDDEMRDPSDRGEGPSTNPPLVKRESTAPRQLRLSSGPNLRSTRSDDEEEVPESEEGSIARSSDTDTKYKREDSPLRYTPEQVKQRRLKELAEWILRFAPDVFFAIAPLNNWSPWHCTLPPISMPFRSPQSLANRHKCRYLIDLRKPSDNMVRLLRNSTELGDAELLKHLLAKPSPLGLPWDELSTQILKRSVELHWEEHYVAWGVKKVLRQGDDKKIRARFEYIDD